LAQFGARITPGVEAVLIERLLECVDLRLGGGDLGFSDLAEITRRHVADQQADDRHDNEQLQQRESGRWPGGRATKAGTHDSPSAGMLGRACRR